MTKRNETKPSAVKVLILLLCILLTISVAVLAGRIIYLNLTAPKEGTAVVPDNILQSSTSSSETDTDFPSVTDTSQLQPPSAETNTSEPDKGPETAITLHARQTSDNKPFQAENLLPGDKVIGTYAVKVTHKADVAVYFQAEVREEIKNLAQILQIKVTRSDTGKILYEGPFASLSQEGYGEVFKATPEKETVTPYEIEVSLPTSAGNEYSGASLTADFQWSVRETDVLLPPTSDREHLLLYTAALGTTALALLLFFVIRQKRKGDDHGKEA